ncbi:hypothetical protein [uncultured Deefgea sp.]|uniref:hypothetical protein n=1 Tax=uncultured Deefgea sp. TaxID=1304914 RepID=UPI0025987001|nr:hypothetical protein [uncultured Deefgea sp.]
MTELVSQAEFARQQGWAKSYVTKLKLEGRLVMDGDKVDVAASRAKIAASADPNRDDVRQRHANERGNERGSESPSDNKAGSSYQNSRAVKERFAALTAKMEYEIAIGKLIQKSEVEDVVQDLATLFRQGLENMPHRIAAELVGRDVGGIRAVLKEAVIEQLKEFERNLDQRISAIGTNEENHERTD